MNNIPGVQETRVLLRARGIILAQYSPPDRDMADLQAISSLCQRRIAAVGVRQYVYDILGSKANQPAREFKLWYGVETVSPNDNGKLVDFLLRRGLPDKIEETTGRQQTFYLAV